MHIRCGEVNDTALTYGFAIRDNTFEDPPPDAYLGDVRYPDSGIGAESGGQVTVGYSCTAGLVEGTCWRIDGQTRAARRSKSTLARAQSCRTTIVSSPQAHDLGLEQVLVSHA